MTLRSVVRTSYRKYLEPAGRASRGEFWWFLAFSLVARTLFVELLGATQGAQSLAILAFVVPMITSGVRRLHDVGRRGWWWFAVPVALVLMALPGDPGPNRYGPPPEG